MSADDVRLKAEIKRLLREAAALSQPSTFAQAAKLRRIAAAKEKELAKSFETHGKEISMSFDMYTKGLFFLKICTYLLLVLCFWRVPLGFISQQLVHPFGMVLSWLSGGDAPNYTTIGIIPWIFVSSKASRFLLKRVIK
nr:tail-anchored protein insertion receptor WRB-like protein [Ipomoea batatas]